MPNIRSGNIREYTSERDKLQPTEVGVDALIRAGRTVASNYNEAGQAIAATGDAFAKGIRIGGEQIADYAQHTEIANGAAEYAKLNDNITQAWNATVNKADPRDPSVVGKFRDEVIEPSLEKYRDGFLTEGGQKFAEAKVEAIRNHMYEKTAADMATRAKQAVSVNMRETANSLSNTAMTDPSSVPHLLSSIESNIAAIVDSHPNLKGVDAANARVELTEKMKEQIVKAGAIGAIQKSANPEKTAEEWGAKYPQYINGAELKQLGKAAQTQNRANLLTEKQLAAFTRQQNTERAHAAANKVMSDNVSIDPATNRPVIKPDYFKQALDIAKLPNAPDGLVRTLLDWGEHQQNLKDTPTRDVPEVKQELYTGLFSADKPTSEIDILKAEIDKKITPQTGTMMRALSKELAEHPLKGPIWTDTMAAVKSELILSVPGIPGKDSVGINNFASFAQSFIPQYLAKSRAGALEPNALDVKDPNSMISKAMAPFKRTQAQRMQDYIATVGGITLPGGNATPAARKIGDVPVPAPLGWIAALQYNKSTGQWRDQASGKIYDKSGNEIKP